MPCNRAEFFAQGAVDILRGLGAYSYLFRAVKAEIWKLCRHLSRRYGQASGNLDENTDVFHEKRLFMSVKEPAAGVGAYLLDAAEHEADGRAEQHSGVGIPEAAGCTGESRDIR